MRIRHLIRGRLNPDNADGIITHTYRLAHAQLQLGHDVEVYGVASRADEPETLDREGLTVRAFPPARHRTAVHPALRELIRSEDRSSPTMFHLQAPHDPAVYGVGRLLHRLGIPYMVSPHAMWNPHALSRGAWKKRVYKLLLDDRLVAGAVGVHATAAAEIQDIAAYAPHARAFAIRNSLDLGEIDAVPPAPGFWQTRLGIDPNTRVLAFLGRLDPYQKGLDLLIEAWGIAQPRAAGPGALALIGTTWRDTEDELKGAIDRAGVVDSVHFVGPLYGADKYQALAAADVYVQTSRYETSPYSIQEALASRLPAIVTPPTNFTEVVVRYEAGYAVELDPVSIAEAMRAALELPTDGLHRMGANARRLVEERHSLTRSAGRMIEAYEAALSGSAFVDDD